MSKARLLGHLTKQKRRKTKGRASSKKQCVRRGGAMDSSEQTVLS